MGDCACGLVTGVGESAGVLLGSVLPSGSAVGCLCLLCASLVSSPQHGSGPRVASRELQTISTRRRPRENTAQTPHLTRIETEAQL